jgi:hypothetical protein
VLQAPLSTATQTGVLASSSHLSHRTSGCGQVEGADWILQEGQEAPGLAKEGSGISTSSSKDTYIPDVPEVGPTPSSLE